MLKRWREKRKVRKRIKDLELAIECEEFRIDAAKYFYNYLGRFHLLQAVEARENKLMKMNKELDDLRLLEPFRGKNEN